MSVIWVRPKSGGQESSVAERGAQQFRSEYLVKCSSPTETRTSVLSSGSLPKYGFPHPENPASLCVKVDAQRREDDPHLWDVEADWNAITGNRDPREDQKQPDLRRPKWKFNFTAIQQSLFGDLDQKPFVDTVGTPFDPPPQLPIFVDEVTIQRYEPTCNRANDRAFLNCTNTDNWLGAAPGEALIADIDAQEVFEFGAYWFAYTYTVLVKPFTMLTNGGLLGGWDPYQVLNAGPREIVIENGKPIVRAIKLKNVVDGQIMPLSKSGVPITPLAVGGWSAPFHWIPFRTVNKTAFGPLMLIPPWEM
jgi:hypothetical protein